MAAESSGAQKARKRRAVQKARKRRAAAKYGIVERRAAAKFGIVEKKGLRNELVSLFLSNARFVRLVVQTQELIFYPLYYFNYRKAN